MTDNQIPPNLPISDLLNLEKRMLFEAVTSILEHREYINLDEQYLHDLCVIVATERTRALEDYKSWNKLFKVLEITLK